MCGRDYDRHCFRGDYYDYCFREEYEQRAMK